MKSFFTKKQMKKTAEATVSKRNENCQKEDKNEENDWVAEFERDDGTQQ